ncbi:MAG: hypothetical protein C4309_00965 [Chloroflexota bacterium]|mgnify:CR=1 FL=1
MSKRQLVSLIVVTDLIVLALIGVGFWGALQSAPPLLAQAPQPGDGDPDHDPHPGFYVVPDVPSSTYLSLAGYTFTARPPIPPASPTQLAFYPGGGVYISNPPNNDPLVANLNLPNGAILTEFRFYYYDASDGRDATAELRRTDFMGNIDSLASVSSSGTPGFSSVATTNIQPNTINNASYAYAVHVYLNPGSNPDRLRLYGIRIGYTFANANYLPMIKK